MYIALAKKQPTPGECGEGRENNYQRTQQDIRSTETKKKIYTEPETR